jgi:hypothetical protein
MQDFVFKMEEKDKESLGAVRCMDGLMVAIDNDHIWLKGMGALINMHYGIRQLPVKTTFLVDEHKNLFIPGKLTPVEVLKEMQWIPLMEFINVEPPVAALPGKTAGRIRIKLVPSEKEKKGSALLISLQVWKQYAETASASRLKVLRFAVSEDKEVLVLGSPLPSLPGREYWETEGILLPSGYDFELGALSQFANEKLNKKRNAVIVFDTDGSYQRIEKEFFVTATRSAVRLTQPGND